MELQIEGRLHPRRPGRRGADHSTAGARSACASAAGSAAIGMFATQWQGLIDEVVVVDDHITGVVSEHQAGKVIGWQDTGIKKVVGSRPGSSPRPLFQGFRTRPRLGRHDDLRPAADPRSLEPRRRAPGPGMSLLMVSTTRRAYAYFELDDGPEPGRKALPRPSSQIGRADRGTIASPRSAPCCSWRVRAGSLRAGSDRRIRSTSPAASRG